MSSQDCVCNQLLPEFICCSYGCKFLMSHHSMPSANYSLDGSVGASIMGSFWFQLFKEVWIFIGKDSWTIIFLVFLSWNADIIWQLLQLWFSCLFMLDCDWCRSKLRTCPCHTYAFFCILYHDV
jgi:hypothetical protein